MFHKLRNRLVLVNVAVTTAVLLSAFTAIYIIAQDATHRRAVFYSGMELTQYELQFIQEQIQKERQATLNSLLISLVIVGLTVEAAVVALSYYLAEMAIRPVQKNYEKQKIFIANASHEIKTPLAVMSANLEAAEIRGNRWIDNIEKELRSLTALNQDLLALARADNLELTSSERAKDTVIIKQFLDEVAEPFVANANENGIELEIKTAPKQAKLEIVESDLRQILAILIDNAIKYGKKKVQLEYRENKIQVTNDGATIPAEDYERIFERFYQVDKTAPGAGLGLAIAKGVAERNDWRLSAESKKGKTRFSIEF